MEIKESYRVLELEVGATREAVEAAYCRLLERWHPDRVASGDPAAVREAQRMVQAINDAYQTLVKIAPPSAPPPAPLPTGAPPTTRAKPMLPSLSPAQPASARPAPPPPPSNPAASALPPAPAPTKPLPPPAPTVPPPAASAPPTAAAAHPAPAAPSLSFSKALACYDLLFPVDTPRRRFGPLIVAGVLVLFVLLVAKCASKSPEQIKAAAVLHEAQTTGRLSVKSNRPNTVIEVTRIPAAGEAEPSARKGADEGAAEQAMAALPPGKYTLTARTEGWPDISQEVSVDAARTTEVAVRFKTGSLRVDSLPAGATVKFGNTELGKTPLVVPQLPPGECQLSLQYPSWPAVTLKTTITENTEAAATVRLPHGRLTVDSVPAGATVVLDGKAYNKTPLFFDPVAAGPKKLTLQLKDFPPLEISVKVVDGQEVKICPALGTAFPVLDPAELLRAVWIADDPTRAAGTPNATTGIYRPKNDVVKNLHRERLYNGWQHKTYRYSGPIKSYDAASGRVEFAEQKNELARYRVVAQVRPGTGTSATPAKGFTITLTLYGRLTAVEEPAWPARVITFELSDADFLPEGTP